MAPFKLMIVGCRRSGMTRADMQGYMRDVHGPKVLRNIELEPLLSPQRYVQNYAVENPGFGDSVLQRAAPGELPPAADFVTEVWFDNPDQARAAVSTTFYRDVLQPDEERFVDNSTVVRLTSREHEETRFGASPATSGASKLFVFLKCAQGVKPGEVQGEIDRLTPMHEEDASFGIRRRVRNLMMAPPGSVLPVDFVDEVWFDTKPQAGEFAVRLTHSCSTTLRESLILPSSRVLLAQERVMFEARGPVGRDSTRD